MESSNLGTVTLQPVAASVDEGASTTVVAPVDPTSTNTRLLTAIFCASLALHAALLVRLQTGSARPHIRSKPSLA